MELGLKGKSALVCGASKGLGFACAAALAAEGVALVVIARGPDALERAARELRSHGVAVVTVVGDVTTAVGRHDALAAAAQLPCGTPGRFDIVVTNAGGPPPGNFRDWSTEDWLRAINANMLSAIELIRATVDSMIERRWGRIVNITSAAVKSPNSYLGLSNGARSGLTGFVAGLAREVAPHGVTINNLLPGSFDTERLRGNLQTLATRTAVSFDEARAARLREIPPNRLGQPEEFGAACAFLCSNRAGYINAQNLLLDGGAYPGTF